MNTIRQTLFIKTLNYGVKMKKNELNISNITKGLEKFLSIQQSDASSEQKLSESDKKKPKGY
jgi:hypothetical protein